MDGAEDARVELFPGGSRCGSCLDQSFMRANGSDRERPGVMPLSRLPSRPPSRPGERRGPAVLHGRRAVPFRGRPLVQQLPEQALHSAGHRLQQRVAAGAGGPLRRPGRPARPAPARPRRPRPAARSAPPSGRSSFPRCAGSSRPCVPGSVVPSGIRATGRSRFSQNSSTSKRFARGAAGLRVVPHLASVYAPATAAAAARAPGSSPRSSLPR